MQTGMKPRELDTMKRYQDAVEEMKSQDRNEAKRLRVIRMQRLLRYTTEMKQSQRSRKSGEKCEENGTKENSIQLIHMILILVFK